MDKETTFHLFRQVNQIIHEQMVIQIRRLVERRNDPELTKAVDDILSSDGSVNDRVQAALTLCEDRLRIEKKG